MKLESLNVWGGRMLIPLLDHIKQHASEIDIFCFQEILNNPTQPSSNIETIENLFEIFESALPNHQGYFNPALTNNIGLATFIKKSIKVVDQGDIFVYRWLDSIENNDPTTLGRNMQFIQFELNNQTYTVANLHGLWTGAGTSDTPDRIKQSEIINDFFSTIAGPSILCGDFNLDPSSKSIELLEQGRRNLIREYKVESTRADFFKWPDKIADYMLVSKNITVNNFQVQQQTVSDHLPLILDFK